MAELTCLNKSVDELCYDISNIKIEVKKKEKEEEEKQEEDKQIKLDELYTNLYKIWDENLKQYGVKIPKKNCKQSLILLYLYKNIRNYIHIDEIKKFASLHYDLTGTEPIQVRHLSTQKGWCIIKDGKYKFCLSSVVKPKNGFILDKRNIEITENDWINILEEYDYMCVNCGSKENEPLRFSKNKITKLEKGHMDPRKDLTLNNCIPQCEFCNKSYKNKAIFNKHGIIINYNKKGF